MHDIALPLLAADLRDDLSRFHLIHYGRQVDGFLVSGHNSGTHWLRFMLSAAIAHHLDLPPPARSSGPQSDVFIGHARHGRVYPQAPRIGSSHHLPSRLIGLLAAVPGARLPPLVLLVRHIPDALTSYFYKWREAKQLGALDEFIDRPPQLKSVDLWWYVRFFNRWGALQRLYPGEVLVVRYEDLKAEPGPWIERIWSHWGVALSAADVAAGLAVSSRTAVAAHLDPAYGEDVAPERKARQALSLTREQAAKLQRLLARHLTCDFGYLAAPA